MEIKEKISWKALEYEEKERSNDWFWAVGIIALSIAVGSIIYKNYLFAIFIVLAAVTLVMYHFRKPKEYEIEISKKGIKIGNEFHPYKELKSFWIDTADENHKKLILNSSKVFMPIIVLPMQNDLENDLRQTLPTYLKEEETTEPISHKIMEYLGF